MLPGNSGARGMPVISRLLLAAAVGVAHFVMTLVLGPSIHCAEARGCHANDWIQAPPTDVFAMPLSLVRETETYASFFAGHSFGYYSTTNSIAFGLLVLAVLSIGPAASAALSWFKHKRGRA
jgi:hypothetical protein